jgi:hypothetical protein
VLKPDGEQQVFAGARRFSGVWNSLYAIDIGDPAEESIDSEEVDS